MFDRVRGVPWLEHGPWTFKARRVAATTLRAQGFRRVYPLSLPLVFSKLTTPRQRLLGPSSCITKQRCLHQIDDSEIRNPRPLVAPIIISDNRSRSPVRYFTSRRPRRTPMMVLMEMFRRPCGR